MSEENKNETGATPADDKTATGEGADTPPPCADPILLPCPLCGAEAHLHRSDNWSGYGFVACTNIDCGCANAIGHIEESVRRWNERMFFTPPDALAAMKAEAIPAPDAVVANPPMPSAHTPATAHTPEERHMSRPEAAHILMDLMRRRSNTEEHVVALGMGALRLLNKHLQCQRNWARRRAAYAAQNAAADANAEEPKEADNASLA